MTTHCGCFKSVLAPVRFRVAPFFFYFFILLSLILYGLDGEEGESLDSWLEGVRGRLRPESDWCEWGLSAYGSIGIYTQEQSAAYAAFWGCHVFLDVYEGDKTAYFVQRTFYVYLSLMEPIMITRSTCLHWISSETEGVVL